jgi:sigma-B regulation protein RsbU (phosphoserine phosphatase)
MVLGVFPESTYSQTEVIVGAGDRLIFYTDGITEARRPGEDDEYGVERLTALALGRRRDSAEVLKTAILDDVNRFTHGHFEDDATLIVVALT